MPLPSMAELEKQYQDHALDKMEARARKPLPLNEPKTAASTPRKPTTKPIPSKDPGFEAFCRHFSFPAYKGLFAWQKRHHDLTWEAKYDLTLVHRKAGKSVLYNNKYQWALLYQEMDVLLLGWTARYKEIAVYVYNFFDFYDLIDRDRRTSEFHFKLKNGGRFDAYLFTSKDTLGKHSEGLQDRYENMTEEEWEEYKSFFEDEEGENAWSEVELKAFVEERKGSDRKLWIAVDDAIDMTFKKERHKEKSHELHFNSTLYGIQPDKWSFTGTRKFEGDFYDFVHDKFKDEPDYVRYMRGIWEDEAAGELLCPEMFTHPKVDTYEQDLKEDKEDLAKVRKHVGEEVWFGDFMQNPHPVEIGRWKLQFIKALDTPTEKHYDTCIISIDRATTQNTSSDFTGCPISLRNRNDGKRTVIEDFTAKITLERLLIKVLIFLIHFKAMYPSIYCEIVVEKQGGGDDFLEMARSRVEFRLPSDILAKHLPNTVRKKVVDGRLPNLIPSLATFIEVHSKGNKEVRIENRLNAPLVNEQVLFLEKLKGSELVKELRQWPSPANDDAADALANSEFEYLKRPITASSYGVLLEELEDRSKEEGKEDPKGVKVFEHQGSKELAGVKKRKKEYVFEC